MSEALRLVTLYYSPWSERSRWMLDHHGIDYEVIQHTPFLGELKLRRLIGKPVKRATVPVLLTGTEVLTDSWDIALYADRVGTAPKLLPESLLADIQRCNDLAGNAMNAGRGLVVSAMLETPGALNDTLPKAIPNWLRTLMYPGTYLGTRWFARKYALDFDANEAATGTMRGALAEFRAAVGSSDYVLGTFTYADILMATALQGIVPVADRYIRLGPALRRSWTHDVLATEFADLIAWRDRIYEKHRGARAEASRSEPT